eukprot:TRINITY_DN18867_c0_g1_i1.p1 TRINITY_DN18867_c0_g1~~TRINITY_DN18867_c0_g1_i1.p1  ORF type:complete len:444 (+),score=90.25 TRINITY_DN18867_c0_g1_i1:69-1400(+)
MKTYEDYKNMLREIPVGAGAELVGTSLGVMSAVDVRGGATITNPLYSSMDLITKRKQIREEWKEVKDKVFETARNVADPLLKVSHREIPFRTRAALKLADVNQNFRVIDKQSSSDITFIDICGAPGSWTEYLCWFTDDTQFVKGWGQSLKTTNDLLDWQLDYFNTKAKKKTLPKDFIRWGPTEDGDVTSAANLISLAMHVRSETDNKGVSVVMGDGGVIEESSYEEMETQLRSVILGEILTMSLTLAKGGNFVLKVLDANTSFTISMLWYLYNEFEEVALVKPLLSRPANSERYFVGKKRRNAPSLCRPPPDSEKGLSDLVAKKELSPVDRTRVLFVAQEFEKEGKCDRLQQFFDLPSEPTHPFVSWLHSHNIRHIEQQLSICQVISAAITNPSDFTDIELLHTQMATRWWDQSDLRTSRRAQKVKTCETANTEDLKRPKVSE